MVKEDHKSKEDLEFDFMDDSGSDESFNKRPLYSNKSTVDLRNHKQTHASQALLYGKNSKLHYSSMVRLNTTTNEQSTS